MLKTIIDIPEKLWKGIYQTGSSVICSPPVTNTDIDFIICTLCSYDLDFYLKLNGFKLSRQDNDEI